MNPQDHHDDEHQLGAYAIGALDLEDLPAVEAELAASPGRREELRQLREVVALLPYAAQPVEPPDRVRRALMARIAASAATQPAAPAAPARRRGGWLLPGVVAALATIVLALAGLTLSFGGTVARLDATNRDLVAALDSLQQTLAASQERQEALAAQLAEGQRRIEQVSAELAAGEERIGQLSVELAASEERIGRLTAELAQDEYVISFVSAPGVATRRLTPPRVGAIAQGEMYMYPGNPSAVVLFSGLPALQPGQVYQFWLADGSTQVAGGTFVVDASGLGHIVVQAPREVNAFSQVMVTVEPEGGSTAPSEMVVLEGSL